MRRTNPFQKLYDICNREDFAGKTSRVKPFPILLDVELTNCCNLNCLMCPTGTGAIKRPRGFMTDAVFDRIVDEARNRDVGLRFIRWGEPLLHRKLLAYVEKAKRNGLLCHINTNGHLLTEAAMRELIRIPLDSLKFSFQGVNAESYDAMRRNGGGFDALARIVERFHALRGEASLPFIHIASTVTRETPEETAEFREKFSSFCDLLTIGRTQLEHLNPDDVALSPMAKDELRRLQHRQSLVKTRLKQCPEVFDKLSVNWDGTVTACCGDYDGKMILGDLRESALEELWRSDALGAIRRVLARRDYDKLEQCRGCYDYMALQSDDNKVV